MKKLGSPKDILLMTVGTLLVAGAVFFFLVPSDIPLGSVSGLAIVINQLTHISVSFLTLLINVVLLIIGFITIGREFGAKTIYTSILMPLMMRAFELMFPDFQSIMGDPILDVVCFLFVCSIGLTMLFNLNASSGGLDIIAKIFNKYFRWELGISMSIAGMIAALSAALCYDLKTVILSLLGTYLSGVVLDHFIFSFGGKKKVCILSQKEDEIKDFILNDLYRGATIYNAYGAYDNKVRHEIVTLLDKNEYRSLLSFIGKTDPSAFVSVYSVSEVLDNSQRNPKNKPVRKK